MADRLSAHLDPGEPVLYRSGRLKLHKLLFLLLGLGAATALIFGGVDWLVQDGEASLAGALGAGIAVALTQLWAQARGQVALFAVTDRRVLFLAAEKDSQLEQRRLSEIEKLEVQGSQRTAVIHSKDGSRLVLQGLTERDKALQALRRVVVVPLDRDVSPRIRRAYNVINGSGLAIGITTILAPYVFWPSATTVVFDWLNELPTALGVALVLFVYVPALPVMLTLGCFAGAFATLAVLRFSLSPEDIEQILAIDVDWHGKTVTHRLGRLFLVVFERYASLIYGQRIRCPRPSEAKPA